MDSWASSSPPTPGTPQRIEWADFGHFLIEVRRRRGLSQERLAALLGCHRISVWRIEHGQRRASGLFLHCLGEALDLSAFESERLAKFQELRLLAGVHQ